MWTCIPGATAWMQNPSWVFFALNLARELTVDSPTLSEEELHKKFAAFLAG